MAKGLPKAQPVGRSIFRIVVSVVAIPYHRFFTRNTLWPAQEIARCANAGYDHGSPERPRLHLFLCDWQERKRNELSFVSIMSIALTAVVSASFSWPVIQQSFWLGPATWYATLMWSVFGILVTAQQMSMLASVGDLPKDHSTVPTETLRRHLHQFLVEIPPGEQDATRAERNHRQPEWQLSWKSIFIWQLPLMSFGYAFLLYIIGLTSVVCTPLLHDHSGDDFKIAMFYITSCAIGAGLFIYSATLGYNTIELAEDKSGWEDRPRVQPDQASTETAGEMAPRKEYDTLIRSLTGASQISAPNRGDVRMKQSRA